MAATHPTRTDSQAQAQVIAGHALAGWIALCQGRPADASLTTCRAMLDEGAAAPPPVAFLEGAHLLLTRCDPRGIDLLGAARLGFAQAGKDFLGDQAMAELIEALAAAFIGTRQQAMDITQRCLDHAGAVVAPWAFSWARLVRGMALMWHGDPDKAVTLERDTLRWGRAVDDRWGTVWALHALAWALAERLPHQANPTDAATEIAFLLGGADRLRRRTGVSLPGLRPFAEATTKAIDAVQGVLTEDVYTAAYQRGLDSNPAAVLATAVGETYDTDSDGDAAQARPTEPWDLLTTAEQQVARLAAQGLSNPQIAARRSVSRRTVETQMTAILRGLDITDRHQIASMIPTTDPTSDTASP